MNIPEQTTPMPAGEYPEHLLAACAVCEVEPGQLLAWSVRNDAVTLILPGGQKVVFMVSGKWLARQEALPFDYPTEPPAAVGPGKARRKR